MNNPPNHLHGQWRSATASYCSESTSSQSPLKRFQLSAQDMMEHFSAAAVTVSNTEHYLPYLLFCWLQELLRKQWT